MKEFKDLVFEVQEDVCLGKFFSNKQAIMFFPNGYGVSVLMGRRVGHIATGLYSDGVSSYEMAVLRKTGEGEWDYEVGDNAIDEATCGISGIYGYLQEDGVTNIMKQIQELKPYESN